MDVVHIANVVVVGATAGVCVDESGGVHLLGQLHDTWVSDGRQMGAGWAPDVPLTLIAACHIIRGLLKHLPSARVSVELQMGVRWVSDRCQMPPSSHPR